MPPQDLYLEKSESVSCFIFQKAKRPGPVFLAALFVPECQFLYVNFTFSLRYLDRPQDEWLGEVRGGDILNKQ
jgi:hypothetical protein